MIALDALSLFSDRLQAAGRSPRTITAYLHAITRMLQAMDLTPIDLAKWRRQRAAVAKPATLNLEVDPLRQFFPLGGW